MVGLSVVKSIKMVWNWKINDNISVYFDYMKFDDKIYS